MKIGEIIELTQTTPLNEIAKEHLTIGEKKAREGMKAAGAEPQRGKKGWIFNGYPENLEKSIYEFVEPSQRGRRKVTAEPAANVPTNKPENQPKIERTKVDTNQPTAEPVNEPENHAPHPQTPVIRKRSSFDIDVELTRQLRIKAVMEDKNIYEMVEQAIRDYLKKEAQN